MFLLRSSAALRSAIAPAMRPAANSVAQSSLRAFSSSVRLLEGHGPPIIQGEGSKSGEVPSNLSQATGSERFELLGRMQGVDVWGMQPLDATRVGTIKDPILVESLYPERVIGCTGSPADSHDTVWISLNTDLKHHRCPECGSVYSLNYLAPPEDHGDEHH
ncbi:cytochrome c oxidase polypeptide IV [Jaminaea rosea]|uniref:Cytochrome c oxidase polypeptide IV n=1 Tax=Jaminaea rosea TaxID=1569628 RepID=A0A316UKC3_9BASI|nr:cytochrome c oxidase polypeptide IV [Jaminaea rosea]PWN25248.1 cytochrome c oxidase polypeptide IV [Jaminaea rosea]